ncbi:MAG: type IV pilus assembly protein PilM [Proteobacteria bacterium]|nr:type IV pilus assembly protein PilM [Pseudomonadota bacterium]
MAAKLFSFSKKAAHSIGIELGGHTIKMIETLGAGGRVQLLTYGIVEIPSAKQGKASRDAAVIAPLIKELLARCSSSSADIYFSVSGPSFSLQRIKLPPMPEQEILAAIRWQGKKYFPFSLDEARVVYKKIAGISAETSDLELITAAVLNKFMDQELSLLEQAGYSAAGIDAVPFALQYAFQLIGDQYHDKTVAVLDIGAEGTTIAILRNGELQFAREITTGGNDFTRALMEPVAVEGKHFALTFEEAEAIKKKYGIPMGGGLEVTPEGLPLSRIMFIIRPVLERLSTEALRSFDFYKAKAREKRIDKIFICGGGAGFKNLAAFISSGLGIDGTLFDPFGALLLPGHLQNDSTFQQHKSRLSVALGLSAGRCRDINFLPPQPGILETVQLRTWIPLLVFILFFSSLATMYLYSYRSVAVSREELRSKESQLSSLMSYMQETIRLNEKKENLKQRLSQVPDFSFEQPQFSEILSSLTRTLPDNTVLQSIMLEKDAAKAPAAAPATADKELVMKLRLEGIVFGDDSKVLATLVQITNSLEKSPCFQKVMLVSSEKTADFGMPAARFVFSCPLRE